MQQLAIPTLHVSTYTNLSYSSSISVHTILALVISSSQFRISMATTMIHAIKSVIISPPSSLEGQSFYEISEVEHFLDI